MKLLLDTHIMLWAMADDEQLPEKARGLIENEENEIYFSIISLWEIQIKHILHPQQMESAEVIANYCKEAGFSMLSLSMGSISKLPKLSRPDSEPRHKDPFDRMLICQAITEKMTLLTHDSLLSGYGESAVLFL